MKKIIFCLSLSLFLNSCEKNCDEEIAKLNEQYKTALFNAGGSTAAIIKVNSDYQFKLGELNERCN